jgi:hypothetical protein
MVIIASKEGQFANRVLHFQNIFSFCKVNRLTLYHAHFSEFQHYFPALKNERGLNILEEKGLAGWLRKALLFLVKALIRFKIYNLGFLEIIYYDRYDQGAPIYNLDNPELARKARRKILVLYGWLFRSPENLKKEEAVIKKAFELRSDLADTARKYLNEFRQQHNTIVGVHIRRGDYKNFENGRWFYDNEVYRSQMLSVRDILSDNSEPLFLICSNEHPDQEDFQPLTVTQVKDHFLVDFLLLTMCDRIIGPPSTFSALASWWGNVPLQFIQERNTVLNSNSFQVVETI